MIRARANVRRAEIHAVVIRADGTREDQGLIALYDRNPLRRWAWNVARLIRHR